jgi:hypothetical protein
MFSPDYDYIYSYSVVSLALESQSFLFLQLFSSTIQLFLCSDCHGVRFNLFSSIPRLFPGIPVLPSISCGRLSNITAMTDEIRRNVFCNACDICCCLSVLARTGSPTPERAGQVGSTLWRIRDHYRERVWRKESVWCWFYVGDDFELSLFVSLSLDVEACPRKGFAASGLHTSRLGTYVRMTVTGWWQTRESQLVRCVVRTFPRYLLFLRLSLLEARARLTDQSRAFWCNFTPSAHLNLGYCIWCGLPYYKYAMHSRREKSTAFLTLCRGLTRES